MSLISLIATVEKERLKQSKGSRQLHPLAPKLLLPRVQVDQEEKLLCLFPLCDQSTAMLSCQALLLGTRCSSSSELSSGDAGSSPQPWGSTGFCSHKSHTKSRGKPHYHSPACASHNGETVLQQDFPLPGCREHLLAAQKMGPTMTRTKNKKWNLLYHGFRSLYQPS